MKSLRYLLLTLAALVLMFPLYFSLSLALQGETVTPTLIPKNWNLDWGVFLQIFEKEPLLGRWILNSWVVSAAVTLGQGLISILAAYALATFRFRGRNAVFLVILSSLMIPWESTILPNYLAIARWGWKDSYQALIVPFLASGFGVFLLRQAFLSVPKEFLEAAALEGASRWRTLWTLMVPLCRPVVATLGIWTFLNTWNQFYWPLLVVDAPEWRTTQVGITVFHATEIASYNLTMAATIIVILPTLIVLWLGQKQLVEGLTAGGLKG